MQLWGTDYTLTHRVEKRVRSHFKSPRNNCKQDRKLKLGENKRRGEQKRRKERRRRGEEKKGEERRKRRKERRKERRREERRISDNVNKCCTPSM